MKKKIIIASDSYKGSASTFEVEASIEEGIKRVEKQADVLKIPIADGGEGTVDAIIEGCGGEYRYITVTGPYQQMVQAKFGLIDTERAVIEMAQASGLMLVGTNQMNPMEATSYGTGELINEVLAHGVKEIYIGIGGSATNDGGVGMAQALGVSFKDADGKEIALGAKEIAMIDSIDISNINPRLKETVFYILSDVSNPLCGQNGASFIYGKQKGASGAQVLKLDEALCHYGQKIQETLGITVLEMEGAGAAGGLGAGLLAFCDAEMCQGISKILELLKLEEYMKKADVVITGEGRMDGQSLNGKAPVGIAILAKKYDIPVIAIVGSASANLSTIYETGIDYVLDIINEPMEQVERLLVCAGEQAMRLIQLGEKIRR
ncbi:glycerate kinase [Enterococcus faecium]|nr:glycerate kinase [Enterococcus faecium]EME8232780.1 glycerate kinase [Enterococcus faecium]NTR80518.1 glycerate kinase [Enterococcus faecium]